MIIFIMSSTSTKIEYQNIDKKWQKIWEKEKTFKTKEIENKKKYYVLDMFPYPSGVGLHMGHLVGYTCTDVISRLKRLEGYNVLHPMGWDSFGLPAEQYAMRHNKHPKDITEENVNNFKRQLKKLGFSYDWDREIFTSSPSYYKWTQFIFAEMCKRDLAYLDERDVNFCPALGTVLAKEEIDNGRSKEGKHPVIIKKTKQWILKITAYADKLLEGLDDLDWPESIKEQQRKWIGKIQGHNLKAEYNKQTITVFVRNIKNIQNAVCLIVSDEHDLALDSSKTLQTVNIDGMFDLPVYVSNYGKDKYGLDAYVLLSGETKEDDAFIKNNEIAYLRLLEDIVLSNDAVKEKTVYRLKDWVFARQRYWGEPVPVNHFEDSSKRVLDIEELPLELPDNPIYDSQESEFATPLSRDKDWINIIDVKTGNKATRDANTMPQWAGSCWYYLRFMDPKNDSLFVSKEKEEYWKNVDIYIGGAEHAVLHLLYARFWHKFLYDIGLVSSKEPFQALRNQGLIYANAYIDSSNMYYPKSDVNNVNGIFTSKSTGVMLNQVYEKMSKSKLNGESPDFLLDKYGADAVRMYILFMGPFEQDKKFEEKAISGCVRFINKFFITISSITVDDIEKNTEVALYVNRVWSLVSEMKFNVAISELMKLFNTNLMNKPINSKMLKTLLALTSTIAPHVCSELWESKQLKGNINVYSLQFLDFEEKGSVSINVMVNGKFMGIIQNVASESDAMELAIRMDKVAKKLEERKVKRVVFVQGKLINIILQ